MYAITFYFWVQAIIANCGLYLRIFLNLFFFFFWGGQKTSVPFHVYQICFLKVSLFFEKETYFIKPTKKSHTESLQSRTKKQLTTQIRLQKRQYKGRGNALPNLIISCSSSVLCELMGH